MYLELFLCNHGIVYIHILREMEFNSMRSFLNSFTNSIQLPKKQAVFHLNRIGMDITVLYLFLLLIIASIPALIDQIINIDAAAVDIHPFFWAIYFFIFYYLIFTTIVFIVVSAIAYIATILARIMNRKLRYNIMWKMVAFSTTLPFLLFTLFSIFFHVNYTFLSLTSIYIFFNIMMIIRIYPAKRKK